MSHNSSSGGASHRGDTAVRGKEGSASNPNQQLSKGHQSKTTPFKSSAKGHMGQEMNQQRLINVIPQTVAKVLEGCDTKDLSAEQMKEMFPDEKSFELLCNNITQSTVFIQDEAEVQLKSDKSGNKSHINSHTLASTQPMVWEPSSPSGSAAVSQGPAACILGEVCSITGSVSVLRAESDMQDLSVNDLSELIASDPTLKKVFINIIQLIKQKPAEAPPQTVNETELRKREENVERREEALNLRDKELTVKENCLKFREEELNKNGTTFVQSVPRTEGVGNQTESQGSRLMRQICVISDKMAKTLKRADITTDSEIQKLTREDLNELLPGLNCLKQRIRIYETINTSIQGHCAITRPNDWSSDDYLRANPCQVGLPAGDLHMGQQQPTQGGILSFMGSLFGAKENSEKSSSHTDGSLPFKLRKEKVVKVHCLVSGKTLDSHLTLLQQVKAQGGLELQETHSPDTCDVIILFCPIVSRMGTDIEAAMKLFPDVGDKVIIRVVLHHTFIEDYTMPHVSADSRVKYDVSALFHDTQRGLLQCEINNKAVQKIYNVLLKHSSSTAQPQYQ